MFEGYKTRTILFGVGMAMSILNQASVIRAITFEEDTTLTIQQKHLLEKFRKLVYHRLPHEYMKEDIYLVKWLRTKNFDIAQAEKFLLNNLEWRAKNDIDSISQEDWSDFEKDYKYYLEGRDKYGRSFLYFDVHTIDVRGAVIRNGERFLRYCDKSIEESCQLVRHLGEKYKNITRGHLFINLEGYNLVEHGCLQCIPFLLRIVLSYRDHYPECVDKMLVINAPAFVEPLLNSIRPLLSPQLQQQLKIYGTNKRIWKEELAKDFELNQLPPGAGGTAIYAGMEYDY